ncbi:MAG: PAS domain-containing sensor histidine kinase [Candidatus Desulfofervidus auxilii]|nr:PAS domain-containing sensor histidine kinase [Candidatus Desulfofervidus auxilii]
MLREEISKDLSKVEKIVKELKQLKANLEKFETFLRKSEEKYKNLLERSSDIIFVHQDGKIVLASNACAFLLGARKPEELIGRDLLEEIVHPDYKEIVRKRVKKIIEKGEEVGFLEEKIIKLNGEIIDIDVCAVPFSYKGRPAVKVYARDITKRKRAEEELRRSHQNLHNLSTYLQRVLEEERARISREIHDELGQLLTVLKIEIRKLKERILKDKGEFSDELETIKNLIDIIINRTRTISYQLRPPLLDHVGLYAAIEWQIEEFQRTTGIKCKLKMNPGNITLDKEFSIALFRVLQEALTNVARHSGASNVNVVINKIGCKLVMRITDNGIGISQEKISDSKSLGIISIKERISYLGGSVKIYGKENSGTTVLVTIPLCRGKSSD